MNKLSRQKIILTPSNRLLDGITIDAEHVHILLDTTIAGFTVTLPDCTATMQRELIFKNIGTNNVTIQAMTGQYIDKSISHIVRPLDLVGMWSDLDKTWWLLDANGGTIPAPLVIGDETNNTTIEADGTMKFNGAATVWNDLNTSVQSLATSGASILDVVTVGSNNFRGFIGTGVQIQQADGSFEILHDYKEGSDITPHLHWMPVNTNAGNVKVSLGYRWWNGSGAMPAETVISFTVAASGVQYQEKRSDFGTIVGTGKTIGSRFIYRIFRNPADAADTYASQIIALDFGIHYERDTLGSRLITTK